MVDYTDTLRLREPTVQGDDGAWAGYLNSDLVYIDQGVNQAVTKSLTGLTSYTLLADGSSGDEARYQAYAFTGTLSAGCTVTLPGNQKIGLVRNSTTGGYSVTLTTGSGTTGVIPNDGYWYRFVCDGTNIVSWPEQSGAFANTQNGYVTLPGGIMLQWGTTTSGSKTITFPTAFSATAYSVTATWRRNDGVGGTPVTVSTDLKTATTFNTITTVGSSSFFIDWFAVGPA